MAERDRLRTRGKGTATVSENHQSAVHLCLVEVQECTFIFVRVLNKLPKPQSR